MQRFIDRQDAGKQLADQLLDYSSNPDTLVLALPRGGVPVGFEISQKLHLPLDVLIVRKLGVPGHKEFAMGAITSQSQFLNEGLIQQLGISDIDLEQVIFAEQQELARREATYRNNRPLPTISNQTIILVDDGIATGATMKSALITLRKLSPKKIVVAAPVADQEVCHDLLSLADDVVCLLHPSSLEAVGLWYEQFEQTTDEEVRALLQHSA